MSNGGVVHRVPESPVASNADAGGRARRRSMLGEGGVQPTDTTDTTDTGTAFCDLSVRPIWLSADDSNSMASAALARGRIEENLDAGDVRVYEFMNYYTFDYPPAPAGQLAVHAELVPADDQPAGTYYLQVGVSSEARTNAERSGLNLALALDTSGSMSGPPIENEKAVCNTIASQLRAGDRISMVTWNTQQFAPLLNHTVTGPNDPVVTTECDALTPGGGTNLDAGLQSAYSALATFYDPGLINRVVLISDGLANVGVTSAELIGERAGSADTDGIYLVGVGTDIPQFYNDALMDEVTDLGKGASVYVDSQAEVTKMFDDRFVNTMDVAARNVEVQLTLPPGFEIVRETFSGEQGSGNREEVDPQHIAPNDAMVFFQAIQTCAPAAVSSTDVITVAVHWQDEDTFFPVVEEQTFTIGDLLAADAPRLHRGHAITAYVDALQNPTNATVQRAFSLLSVADAHYPGDPELAEIRSVLNDL